ncbi:MAG: ice-binding family protein [Bacteroidia bacterium]
MKSNPFHILCFLALALLPELDFGQAPNLGTAADFVLFTSAGAVSNTGISQVTGNVGTNSGLSTAFGNVNGVMHDNDGASGQCSADLLIAYNQLNSTVPTFFPASLLGNGQVLISGVYSIAGATTLNLDLTLDAQNNPGAVFIIQIQGPFSANANSKVKLINGALACNVYWKVEGLVSMASGTTMRGTVIANNAAINMNAGDTLEGRALSTTGAITIDGVLAYTPIGCGSPVLTGPLAPSLVSAACYALFSSDGPVTNTGVTNVTGDVGTDLGLTTGYNPLFVTGMIHPIPDGSTAACASDLLNAYSYLNTLPYDIELLYPAQFGNNLVLTPHTYRMNAAVTFTDTLYLNAEGNPNAVFVIQVNGAFSTSTFSNVVLINGTQSKNVYWKVEGAVSINDNSIFRGTIICNNGAINLTTGVLLDGRALTTTGALNTTAVTVIMPPGCGLPPTAITSQPANQAVCAGSSASFSVNAAGTAITYQWRKGTVNLINGGNISGATSATLIINPVNLTDTAFNYNVVISGAPNDTSINVSLAVNAPPAIFTQPVNQAVCPGGAANFFVAATGAGLTYQWRKGIVNLVNGVNISGATSATLIINPVNLTDTSSNYNVVISGSCSPNDTSVDVSLLIGPSGITTQPTDQTACSGNSISFSVSTAGSVLSYQWRKGNLNLVNGGNISGANSAVLTINPATIADTASDYNVVVLRSCSNDTSADVSFQINNSYITTQPASQLVCSGASVSFSVSATGASPGYQWRKGNVNLVNGGNISGATTSTLIINPAGASDTASNYNVVITGMCLPNDTSLDVSLSLGNPNITTAPSDVVACPGNSISFSVAATGNSLGYQWRKGSVNLVNGGNTSGATTATLIINPVSITDTASNYNVVVSGMCAPNDTSINVSLDLSNPIITAGPTDLTLCSGNPATFSVLASGAGLSYQWRKGTVNLNNGGNLSGVTSSTLLINPAGITDAASDYNVIVSGTCPPADTSVNATLTVGPTPLAGAGSNSPACTGSSVNLTAQTVASATYSWTGPNGYTSAAQNPVILIATALDAGTYTLTVSANGCSSLASTTTVIVLNCLTPDLAITKTVNNSTPIIGSNVVFTITAFNNGPGTATGVEVNDILQSGYTAVSYTSTIGTYDPSTGIWTIGIMTNGASAVLTVTVTVVANGNYVNTAIIYGAQADSNMTNNVASVETWPTDFNIPEGFSPNGDGINDEFVIRGISAFPDNTFQIFNRWGNKVFYAQPYQNIWDGKSSGGLSIGGNQLPVGTYFYILDLGDGSPVFKGTIYLNK